MLELSSQGGMAVCDFCWLSLHFMSLGAHEQTIQWQCFNAPFGGPFSRACTQRESLGASAQGEE